MNAPSPDANTNALRDLQSLLEARHDSSIGAIAYAAVRDALTGQHVSFEVRDPEGHWRVEGTVTDLDDFDLHGAGPAAKTDPNVSTRRCGVIKCEISFTAQIRGQITRLTPLTRTWDAASWIIDGPVDLYCHLGLCMDPEDGTIVAKAVTLDPYSGLYDLSRTGIHLLDNWGLCSIYEPPWAESWGGTGTPSPPSATPHPATSKGDVTLPGIGSRTTQTAKRALGVTSTETPEPGLQRADPHRSALPATEERSQP